MTDRRALVRVGAALDGVRGQDAVDRLLVTAIDVLAMTGASIAVVGAGRHLGSLAMAGDVRDVDDLQFSLGEGPCISADGHDGPLLEPDLTAAVGVWPAFAPAAIELGICAAFSFPLRVGAVPLGVLTFYRRDPGIIDTGGLADCLAIARIAAHLLLDLEDDLAPGVLPDRLAEVVDLRRNVHQATGMIAAQLDCDIATALRRLRAYAWSRDLAIGDVADAVLARRLRFDDR